MQRLTDPTDLERMANTIRQDIIKMLYTAGSGHAGGPLGLADIATALYFNVLENIDPKHRKKQRDRVYISCGHTGPVWYATLARAGFFPVEELATFRRLGSRLQGHTDGLKVPGIEYSAGSLGQGLSVACGAALAAKMDKQNYHTFAILSDGEHNEGSIWEAAMLAAHYRLENLTAIVDRNNIQIDGPTEEIMQLESLREKYEAFGWHVLEIDGNNIRQVIDACGEAKAIAGQPVCVIAHTIPGKGVPFMEKDYTWHGKAPNQEEARQALRSLQAIREQIA